ncbi:MAG: DUF3795 domain-containing protein [candidate division WOR-3 bacterium]
MAMIGFCGLVCEECPAYIGTQNQDRSLLEETARRWSSPEHEIQPEDILCDGCRSVGKRLNRFCSECSPRLCGLERGVKNCGLCPEYPCKRLQELWDVIRAPEARRLLDRIRAGRG